MNRNPTLTHAIACALGLLLAACGSVPPVGVDDRAGSSRVLEQSGKGRSQSAAAESVDGYTVKKGDTLLAIALDNGKDYRDLAQWNNIDNPNLIRVGQVLRLSPPDAPAAAGDSVVVKPIALSAPPASVQNKPAAPIAPVQPAETVPMAAPAARSLNTTGLKREPKGGTQPYSELALAKLREADAGYDKAKQAAPVKAAAPAEPTVPVPAAVPAAASPAVAAVPVTTLAWSWPVPGKVLAPFNEGSNKGLDLAGKPGEPVLAAAAGKVSYVGSSLRGYGKMVVLKHNNEFLSVYAHNNQILVTEGQAVTAGQKIAELGSTDADVPKLHFEIRRQGKPVDPAGFLPPK